jgi:hypothetical protein
VRNALLHESIIACVKHHYCYCRHLGVLAVLCWSLIWSFTAVFICFAHDRRLLRAVNSPPMAYGIAVLDAAAQSEAMPASVSGKCCDLSL